MRTFLLSAIALATIGCEGELGTSSEDAGAFVADAGRGDAGSVQADAGVALDADAGAALDPDGGSLVDAAEPPAPRDIFFVGNSFTFGGPVPVLVEQLATYAGFDPPNVEYRAVGGQSLEGHRADTSAAGAPARVAEGWDVVVLQELSVRPTDRIGPADQFKEDATWFYDRAKDANEGCEVVLFETWARRAGHTIYPRTFTDPADMQAELRFHYRDAAERYIPSTARSARATDVRVAPVGDAWERQLAGGEPPRLHADDDYHAGRAGQYLSALVLYSTIFRRRADGLVPLQGVDEETALLLQASADAVTGAVGFGPLVGAPLALAGGSVLRVDFGPLWVDGWTALPETHDTVGPLFTVDGRRSSGRVTAWGFSGTQEGGSPENVLDLPPDVSRDSLWIGSFDGHDAALALEGRVVIRGLPDGLHRVEIFASRLGNDSGRGRLGRYRIDDAFADLDAADNASELAVLDDVRPDRRGEIVIRVGVSPDGLGRFAYVGALRIVRIGD